MSKILSIDLYKAKEKCLELQKTNNRLILKGESPILLTTNILITNKKENESLHLFQTFPKAIVNHISRSYLDALILYLNEHYGVNGIIDYLPIANDVFEITDQLSVYKKYSNEEIKKFILDQDIHALISLKMGNTIDGESIELAEKMSSYSFMGLTGISTELSQRLREKGIQNHMQFGGYFSSDDFKELGYDYTDDTINRYNKFFNLGDIKGREPSRERVWPRTVEVSFKKEDDTYNLERVGEVLINYFSWINQELKEKGPSDAMSPMKPKTYQKN